MTATAESRAKTGAGYFISTSWGTQAVSRHHWALARELDRRGHEVTVLVDKQVQVGEQEGIPVITWPSPRPVRLRDARFLARLVRRHRPKCLFASFGSVNVMLAVGWALRVPYRIAMYQTVTSAIDLDASAQARWKMVLRRWRKRMIYSLATHIVCNSAAAERDLRENFHISGSTGPVFPYSLADPLEGGGQSTDRSDARLVCVGRLQRSKGQDVVIRALAVLAGQGTRASVEFIGDGECRSEYEALARELGVFERCQFSGHLAHDEVLSHLGVATAAVVASHGEAFGLVNIEAMAVGTPIIATRVGGIVDIVRDGIDGFLVEPGDHLELAERLSELLADETLRTELGQNARERFLSTYEASAVVPRQADWLEGAADVLANRRQAGAGRA